MRLKILHKKKIILISVLLITLFLFLPTSVIASPKIFKDDGIWIDTFEDESGFQELNNVNLSDGILMAEKGYTTNRTFDFNEEEHEAFETYWLPTIVTPEWRKPLFISFLRRLLLEEEIDNYDGLKHQDGGEKEENYEITKPPSIGHQSRFSVAQHYKFQIIDDSSLLGMIKILWCGYATNASKIEIYVWEHIDNPLGISQIGHWRSYGEINTSTGVLQNLEVNILSNIPKLVTNKVVEFFVLVYPKSAEESILYTDYVKLTTFGEPNFVESGNATSNAIEPEIIDIGLKNWKWDKIIWDGVGLQDIATIKIQVLNASDLKPIGDSMLNGNSKGFQQSPIDISSIPTSIIKGISLKAIFDTKDLTLSARLYNWAVTWQRDKNKFEDCFYTDLRIDKSTGIKLEGGKINISPHHSNWPVFGYNLDNNRVYDGPGPKHYRSSASRTNLVGGVFCNPIFYDGLIYMVSNRFNKIYALNASDSTIGTADVSNKLDYQVEMTPAISEDLLFIATSSNEGQNKIYALNKFDLSDEKWNKSMSNICFSASPTVANGKVFLTSWSGHWLEPFYTQLIDFISKILGGGVNNKILALDKRTGEGLWSNVLPAGSFSTPAVHNHMVFVGCENINGNSLFAFDENTGKVLWNASVGLIGRSSPVVYDNKIFVLIKEPVDRLRWITKIVAVDEYSGNILWNKTIGEEMLASQNIPKDLFAFLRNLGFDIGFENLRVYNLMSSTTPAIHENVVFACSSDGIVYALNVNTGTVIWNVSVQSSFLNVPTYMVASPIIADGLVYTTTWDGKVFALNEKTGEEEWSNIIDPSDLTINLVLSSPIIADGFLFANTVNNDFDWTLFRIGRYLNNTRASVVSKPISLPNGNWWDKFQGNYDNSSNGNVTYSILDENYNVLKDNLNGSNNVISEFANINTNVIRLAAYLSRQILAQDPFLTSWSISWKPETTYPYFIHDSFVPDPSGYINTNTPTCSIKVYDINPGLDVDSAKYGITYISNENKTETRWFNANYTGVDGTRDNITITARISDTDVSKNIKDLKQIIISIKDLAGNNASVVKTFLKDTITPNSYIKNVTDFALSYNEPVSIKAIATDPGEPKINKSGIKSVSLYYRLKNSENWTNYGESSAYNWTFQNVESGEYEFYTIASDNAGNKEVKDQGELSFIYDMTEPLKPNYEDEYRFYSQPDFSIVFEDDYQLESIYYRLNFYGTQVWTKIADNINSKSYTGEWSLSQEDWNEIEDEDTTEEDYYLYFKLIDSAGNQYITPEDEGLQIVKTITEFTYYLDLSDFFELHWDNTFIIGVPNDHQDDIESVILYYRYSDDNDGWNDWKQFGENLTDPPFKWDFNAKEGSGYYEFKTKAWDAAGIADESPVDSIKVTLFPYIAIIVIIGLFILLILFTIFLRGRIKKMV